jgi:cell division protein FtsB|tara:strand:+ start:599 stop:910 length:312 start_codon:yes stop_codon:yes gene_type:complete
MFKFFTKEYFFYVFFSFCTFLVFIFFVFHIFFTDRSLWTIFELNDKIIFSSNELDKLQNQKIQLSSEIDLLRDDNIDSDFLSEIAQELLGLIKPDQIIIKIPK